MIPYIYEHYIGVPSSIILHESKLVTCTEPPEIVPIVHTTSMWWYPSGIRGTFDCYERLITCVQATSYILVGIVDARTLPREEKHVSVIRSRGFYDT